jgi:hypothetical protein
MRECDGKHWLEIGNCGRDHTRALAGHPVTAVLLDCDCGLDCRLRRHLWGSSVNDRSLAKVL